MLFYETSVKGCCPPQAPKFAEVSGVVGNLRQASLGFDSRAVTVSCGAA
jgi:hypothetical protein